MSMKLISNFATLAVLVLSLTSHAKSEKKTDAEKKSELEWQQVSESKSLSQLLRSNAANFWKYAKNDGALVLKDYTKFDGFVTGDPHLGNFGVVPLAGKLAFIDIDLDDGGQGPFVFDFARYVVTVKSIKASKVKVKELVAAYVQGLKREKMEMPERVSNYLKMTLQEYNGKLDNYVAKKVERSGGSFIFKDEKGEIERLQPKTPSEKREFEKMREQMEKVLAPRAILDIATRPKSRGGSADSLRYWTLVNDNGSQRIFEFKEIQEPGIKEYRSTQLPDPERFVQLMKTFWGKPGDKDNQVVQLDGLHFFMRPKKLSLFDTPYKPENKSEEKFLEELTLYDAYYLGYLHGKQGDGNKFAEAIMKDEESFRENLKAFVSGYLEHAIAALKKAR